MSFALLGDLIARDLDAAAKQAETAAERDKAERTAGYLRKSARWFAAAPAPMDDPEVITEWRLSEPLPEAE